MRFVWRFLVSLLYITGSIVTILVAYRQAYAHAGVEGQTAIVGLLILAGVLLVIAAAQQMYFGRKTGYVKIIRPLTAALAEVQRISSQGNSSLEDIRVACSRVVDDLAEVFSRVTGRPCSACIKVIAPEKRTRAGEPARLKVTTLCRDENSNERETRSKRTAHWLDQNTDFEELFGYNSRYFFENCLPWLRDYKNSSFSVHPQPPRTSIFGLGDLIRFLWWPLPYRSTIVSAICPSSARSSAEGEASQTVVGFLCVDCHWAWVFSRPHDIEIITGVAECLYWIIRTYQRKRIEVNRGRIR